MDEAYLTKYIYSYEVDQSEVSWLESSEQN